jgi:hypothetical protein
MKADLLLLANILSHPEFRNRVEALDRDLRRGEPVSIDEAAARLGVPLDVFLDALADHARRQRSGNVN